MLGRVTALGLLFLLAAFSAERIDAQVVRPPAPPRAEPKAPETIEKIGNNLYRIGQIRVDTANHEISVTGSVNPNVMTLEFIANKRGGVKAYETALSLDSDAVAFNTALVLIGLDRTRAKLPTFKFDPTAPEGDPVEIWIECPGGQCERMRAEHLMYDRQAKMPIPEGSGTWVYTGSMFLPDGRYMAEQDGTIIGFFHDPSPIIGYISAPGFGRFGAIVVNPSLGLAAGTQVKLTVKALPQAPAR